MKNFGLEKPIAPSQTCNTPARAMPRRKIDASVIAAMAQAVAKMLTESEAARLCGLEPRHWFEWKSRAHRAKKFADMLEAVRANRIEALLDRIEKSANGVGVKYPDFRAALALLKITDQKRFGDSPASQPGPASVVSVSVIREAIARAYATPLVEMEDSQR